MFQSDRRAGRGDVLGGRGEADLGGASGAPGGGRPGVGESNGFYIDDARSCF